jgi:hypothetical protein
MPSAGLTTFSVVTKIQKHNLWYYLVVYNLLHAKVKITLYQNIFG